VSDVLLGNYVRLRLYGDPRFSVRLLSEKKFRRIFELIRYFLRTYGIRVSCNNILEPKTCLLFAVSALYSGLRIYKILCLSIVLKLAIESVYITFFFSCFSCEQPLISL
jgi:hypothetical protein